MPVSLGGPEEGPTTLARPSPLLELDLDERELEGIRVAHVVLDPGVAIVGLAGAERARGLARRAGGGQRTGGERHHHVGVLVTMMAGSRAGLEAPLGHPYPR